MKILRECTFRRIRLERKRPRLLSVLSNRDGCAPVMPSLTVGLLIRQLPARVNAPRMLNPKEIRQFAIVFAIMNHKVRQLPFFK